MEKRGEMYNPMENEQAGVADCRLMSVNSPLTNVLCTQRESNPQPSDPKSFEIVLARRESTNSF